jgi:hypothetical protein
MEAPGEHPICPTTGKTRYPTEAEAVGPDTTIGIYLCPQCEGYHRTRGVNWPRSVRRAEGVRDDIRRREDFDTSPLARRLEPAVLEELRRIAEAGN